MGRWLDGEQATGGGYGLQAYSRLDVFCRPSGTSRTRLAMTHHSKWWAILGRPYRD